MKVIIFGGAGLIGSAITRELRSHGHEVITAGRSSCDVKVDFRYAHSAEEFAPLIEGADVVINAVGILIERGDAHDGGG
ncbi:MAG: NAD-dependent epimerase/dehydratase family protein [Brachymonas sp.]|nr:NAD-dependent epimerase/dehydratase family protein [Brachymonas sp.]